MKHVLFMVLLIVFTVSLYATPVEDKTTTNSLKISIINSKEVPFNERVLAYDHIAVLNVGIKRTYLYNINTGDKGKLFRKHNDIPNCFKNSRFTNLKRGGNLRFASGH